MRTLPDIGLITILQQTCRNLHLFCSAVNHGLFFGKQISDLSQVRIFPFIFKVVAYLFAQKLLAPTKFFLIRGNHEIRETQKLFTFYK